jgi:hypothetical protein
MGRSYSTNGEEESIYVTGEKAGRKEAAKN